VLRGVTDRTVHLKGNSCIHKATESGENRQLLWPPAVRSAQCQSLELRHATAHPHYSLARASQYALRGASARLRHKPKNRKMEDASRAANRVHAAVLKAGHGWNKHCTSAVEANVLAAAKAGERALHIAYGGLKFRHDFVDGTTVASDVAADGGARAAGAADAGKHAPKGAHEPAHTNHQRDAAQSAGAVQHDARDAAAAAAEQAMRDAKVAQTARERRQRQKAKQKERQAAKREQVAKYATHAYNGVDTPVSKVDVELWSAKAVDLQQAFIRLAGEVTQRCAEEAHKQGRHTKAVSLRFSTKPYSTIRHPRDHFSKAI
jgi:hypothetical protein